MNFLNKQDNIALLNIKIMLYLSLFIVDDYIVLDSPVINGIWSYFLSHAATLFTDQISPKLGRDEQKDSNLQPASYDSPLYPIELYSYIGAGDGNRTHALRLEI